MNLTIVLNVCETWPVILKEEKKLTYNQFRFRFFGYVQACNSTGAGVLSGRRVAWV
jgi:hypothetical protein